MKKTGRILLGIYTLNKVCKAFLMDIVIPVRLVFSNIKNPQSDNISIQIFPLSFFIKLRELK